MICGRKNGACPDRVFSFACFRFSKLKMPPKKRSDLSSLMNSVALSSQVEQKVPAQEQKAAPVEDPPDEDPPRRRLRPVDDEAEEDDDEDINSEATPEMDELNDNELRKRLKLDLDKIKANHPTRESIRTSRKPVLERCVKDIKSALRTCRDEFKKVKPAVRFKPPRDKTGLQDARAKTFAARRTAEAEFNKISVKILTLAKTANKTLHRLAVASRKLELIDEAAPTINILDELRDKIEQEEATATARRNQVNAHYFSHLAKAQDLPHIQPQ